MINTPAEGKFIGIQFTNIRWGEGKHENDIDTQIGANEV